MARTSEDVLRAVSVALLLFDVLADDLNSSTCPEYLHVSADSRKTQADFVCVSYGFAENADVFGKINILSRGMQKMRDEGQGMAYASVRCSSTARIACEVSGAVRSPAAGTHRSD